MKKHLLIGSLFAFTLSASAQFTSNRLAVVRVGSGSAITNNQTSAVFIDEYLSSASNQTSPSYSIPIPTTTTGGNLRLTSIMRSSNTTFQAEGMSSLSPDGNFLAIIGYDQAIGGTVNDATTKVVGIVDAQGAINTSTTLTGRSPARAAIALAGGTAVYSSILQAGILLSTIAGTQTQVNSNVSNARSFTIFNNRLYCANNSKDIPFFNALPTTTGTTTTGNITLPDITNVNQIVLFDADGDGTPDLIYAANDGASLVDAGLYKFKLENNVWVSKGSIKIVGVTDGLRSITGKATGNDIELYAVTWGNLPTGSTSTRSSLLKIVDQDANTSLIDGTNNAPELLATAPANTIFRSVSFTPGTTPETTLPVKLTTFKAQQKQNGIQLNWTTSSESNNAHFEILRATNTTDFSKIGVLKGNGTSSVKSSYTYFDSKPLSGTNYYQLRQVDFNGDSEKSEIIAVDFNLALNQLKVWQSNSETLQLSFNASSNSDAEITISDLSGKKIYQGKSTLTNGKNYISLQLNAQKGLYFINVKSKTELLNSKFLKY